MSLDVVQDMRGHIHVLVLKRLKGVIGEESLGVSCQSTYMGWEFIRNWLDFFTGDGVQRSSGGSGVVCYCGPPVPASSPQPGREGGLQEGCLYHDHQQ